MKCVFLKGAILVHEEWSFSGCSFDSESCFCLLLYNSVFVTAYVIVVVIVVVVAVILLIIIIYIYLFIVYMVFIVMPNLFKVLGLCLFTYLNKLLITYEKTSVSKFMLSLHTNIAHILLSCWLPSICMCFMDQF